MKKHRFITWLTFLLVGIVSLSAQQYSLKGEVLDELGDPLIGATVKVKSDPNNGVMTDINGQFALNVSKGDVLQVSYIGYVTVELPITDQNNIKIEMKEDSQILDEVVVVVWDTVPTPIPVRCKTFLEVLPVCRLVTTHRPRVRALQSSCADRIPSVPMQAL